MSAKLYAEEVLEIPCREEVVIDRRQQNTNLTALGTIEPSAVRLFNARYHIGKTLLKKRIVGIPFFIGCIERFHIEIGG